MNDQDLSARLERLESQHEVERLAVDYSYGFDGQNADIIRRIFHEDAAFDLGDPFGRQVGHDAIVEATEGFWEAMPHMHHNMTNIAVEVDGDVGTGSVNLLCILSHKVEGQVLISGMYFDKYERRNGHWAIADRRFEMHFWCPLKDFNPTMGVETSLSAG